MTAQQIIDRAFGRSKSSQQGVDVSNEGELLPQLYDVISTFFSITARINPTFYMDEEDVAYAAPGWPRPSTAEMVLEIHNSEGTEVVRIPRDEIALGGEPGSPTVYRMGQVYRPTGLASGPAAEGSLTFTFSKKPDPIPTLATEIDALWPVGHESLLDLELALYIAVKDTRESDIAWMRAERDRQLQRYLMHVEHEDVGEIRSRGQVRKFAGASIVPVSSLLAGGSSVEV